MNTRNTGARRPSVVVVTGAANGIGRATSETLLGEGHIVIGIDKDLVAHRHPRLRMLAGDVADVSILRGAAELAASLGDVVGWVNNVGVGFWKFPCEFEATDLRRVIDVNLLSIMMGTSVAAGVLVPGGSVVNMSSIHAARAFQAGSVYAGTKAAIEAFSRGAARDLAPTLRVNVIRPGVIRTHHVEQAIHGSADPAGEEARLSSLSVLGRIGDPKEVAWAVRFLLSEQASFITGSVLVVDGGAGV